MLPALDSMITVPGPICPEPRAAVRIARAGLSLTLPPGLSDSSLAKSWNSRSGSTLVRRIIGVLPIVERMPSHISKVLCTVLPPEVQEACLAEDSAADPAFDGGVDFATERAEHNLLGEALQRVIAREGPRSDDAPYLGDDFLGAPASCILGGARLVESLG